MKAIFSPLPGLKCGCGAIITAKEGGGIIAHLVRHENPKWHDLRWRLSNALVGVARRIYPRNPEVNAFLAQVVIDQMIYGRSVVRVNPAEMHNE